MTKLFLVSCTNRLVNIIEMALVSLVTAGDQLAHGDLVQLLVGEGLDVGEEVLAQVGNDALADALQRSRPASRCWPWRKTSTPA